MPKFVVYKHPKRQCDAKICGTGKWAWEARKWIGLTILWSSCVLSMSSSFNRLFSSSWRQEKNRASGRQQSTTITYRKKWEWNLLADGGFGVLHCAHHLEEVVIAGFQGGGGVRDADGIEPPAELLGIGHGELDWIRRMDAKPYYPSQSKAEVSSGDSIEWPPTQAQEREGVKERAEAEHTTLSLAGAAAAAAKHAHSFPLFINNNNGSSYRLVQNDQTDCC